MTRRLHRAAASIAWCCAALCVAMGAAASASPPSAPVADVGVELPTIGGWHWFTQTKPKYYSPAALADIRDNLHATYVRTGWLAINFRFEKIRWYREDQAMDAVCEAGLRIMIIVPGPTDDPKGEDDGVRVVSEFFDRYTRREFGCIRDAEIVNEADLPVNGFSGVDGYAGYYQRVAPIVASFGIPVITSGTSGKDLPWTANLARLLGAASPAPPCAGYGFHPYGVAPENMRSAVLEMQRASNGSLPVYVTEIGESRPGDLYAALVALAHATPAITVYEYLAQPDEDPKYGLKNNFALYAAVQRAWRDVRNESGISISPKRSGPDTPR